ncbi:MAG TPA: hypothetical protein VH643_00615 [Gemmataceae bacterium]|jgi:hypothetical protein
MAVVSSDNQQLRDRAAALFGLDFRSPAALAEALRCELSARGMASGRSLCERAETLLQPLAALDTARVREVLEQLAASGDATSGPGGMFAAAPLRVVRLGAGRYALHGTLPTARLRLSLPLKDLEGGVTRYATVAADQETALADAISRLGGLVLSPRRWAGLDRVPPAGPEWLEELSHRLDQDRVPAGALDDGLVTPWQAYRPDVGGPPGQRWRSAEAEDAHPGLWRARHEYGWWRFSWTGGRSPGSAPHTRLTRDEARRTQFALDRQAGSSLAVVVRKGQNDVELEVDAFLPRAEYRYLTTLGRRVEADGPPRYLVPIGTWEEAAATLQERLGVGCSEGGHSREKDARDFGGSV